MRKPPKKIRLCAEIIGYSNSRYQGTAWKTRSILDELHKLQPQAITNNRFWNGLQNPNGDYFTPEKYIPASGYPGRTFEVCHTMNESFGYSHHDKKWRSSKDTIHMLIDIVSKGGNLDPMPMAISQKNVLSVFAKSGNG